MLYQAQYSKFIKPVYIGDTITAGVTIESIDDKREAFLETRVIKSNGEIVIEGRAKVLLPERDRQRKGNCVSGKDPKIKITGFGDSHGRTGTESRVESGPFGAAMFRRVSCYKTLDFYPVKAYNKVMSEKKGLTDGILLPSISIISREERVRLCRNAGKVNGWNWNLRLL